MTVTSDTDTDPDIPAVPDGLRLYAIGDVHGCRGHLRALLAKIAADAAAAPKPEALRLVFLGDYIDRGPDSAGVVDDILALNHDGLDGVGPVETVRLMGNHEDYLLRFLAGGGPDTATGWMMNGGAETLESYDVEPPALLGGGREDVERARRDLEAALPAAHRGFYDGLDLMHRAGGYAFVHAGVRPGVALDDQVPRDLIWIREPFLESDADHGAVIVHGHTPRAGVERRPNRLGLDTGAVYGGDLTAACFWGTERHLLSVHF